MGQSEDDPSVESHFLTFDGLPYVAGSADIEFVLAAFESGGDGVDGIEYNVCEP